MKTLLLVLLFLPLFSYPQQPHAVFKSIKVDSMGARNGKLLIKADALVFQDLQTGSISLNELTEKTQGILQFYKDATEGFWIFCGYGFITGCLIYFILNIIQLFLNFFLKEWNRFWRHWNIRKHGYPPVHCDADGDFKFK